MRHGKVKTAKDDMKCQMLKVSLFPIVVFDFQGSRLLNFPHDHAQAPTIPCDALNSRPANCLNI